MSRTPVARLRAVPWVLCVLAAGIASSSPAAPLVVDHTAADRYADIPQAYLDQVKSMWIVIAGESHSSGYRIGCRLLQAADPRFQVKVTEEGTPEGPTRAHLRISRATWGDVDHAGGWTYDYGEEDWFTSPASIQRTQDGLAYCNAQGLTPAAFGFGWCWDMTGDHRPRWWRDPVFQVRWAGRTVGGPDGNRRWGLDAEDRNLTGNRVCMDTYLEATTQYEAFCRRNGLPTRVFFTTGPVDGEENTGENGDQRHVKHEHIRRAVNATPDGILFDYADILCWSNAGVQQTTAWTDPKGAVHTYPVIHPDNLLDLDGTYTEDGDHIGQRGARRLGQAVWWMLARLAGWDGMRGAGDPGTAGKRKLRKEK